MKPDDDDDDDDDGDDEDDDPLMEPVNDCSCSVGSWGTVCGSAEAITLGSSTFCNKLL